MTTIHVLQTRYCTLSGRRHPESSQKMCPLPNFCAIFLHMYTTSSPEGTFRVHGPGLSSLFRRPGIQVEIEKHNRGCLGMRSRTQKFPKIDDAKCPQDVALPSGRLIRFRLKSDNIWKTICHQINEPRIRYRKTYGSAKQQPLQKHLGVCTPKRESSDN